MRRVFVDSGQVLLGSCIINRNIGILFKLLGQVIGLAGGR